VLPGQYPGMAGSQNDVVRFSNLASGSATLDVAVGALQSLELTTWFRTLTLNASLTVQGANGNFKLTGGATINLAAGTTLSLTSLGTSTPLVNVWSLGSITGGQGSTFEVNATALGVQGLPGPLGTKMTVGGLGPATKGSVVLSNMTSNLTLSGADNVIDIGNFGLVQLSQQITANGDQNQRGGIALGSAHTGLIAVLVEAGGELDRNSTPVQGVADQVSIGGAVYNKGGTVDVASGEMLNITGKDVAGFSYWQTTAASALLKIDVGANLNAAGTYQITIGTVQLTAPSGGFADELDGAGLNFTDDNNTSLMIVDSTVGTPGQVTVQGPLSLGAKTTTTLNFSIANNRADLLDVKNGALTLNGTLRLLGDQRPVNATTFNFLDDSGATPSINGAFAPPITGNVAGAMYTGQPVTNNPQLIYYQVTIQ
jgi:hypothetical protein